MLAAALSDGFIAAVFVGRIEARKYHVVEVWSLFIVVNESRQFILIREF